MLNRSRFSSLMVLLLAVSLGAACGDDSSSSNSENNNNLPAPNNVPVPEGSKLLHTGSCGGQINCAMDVSFTQEAPLRVQLVDGNSNPITGARIDYKLEAMETAGTTLNALGAASDDDGFGQVNVRAGTTSGVAEVTVEVPGDNTVEPVKFVIAINPKDSASYRVSFTHDGASDIRDIDVLLFPSTVSCDDFRADLLAERDDDPGTLPMLTAEATAAGLANIDGTLPVVVFPSLTNGSSYTVGAKAKSRANSEVEVALGCADGNDPITNGASVDVVVDLLDHLPRLQGDYSVVHTFSITEAICEKDANGDFVGALPEGACLAIDYIGRLATDPASFLLGQGMGMGDNGLIGLIVDFLPDDGVLGNLKSSITSFLDNQLISGLGRDALNMFFNDWITNNAPAWVRNAVNITGDIYDSVSQFRVNGIIRITREPVVSTDLDGNVVGLLEADMMGEKPGKQVWEDIVVFWTGDCPTGAPDSCRERTFSAGDLGAQEVVEGYFTGSVVQLDDMENPGYGLVIDAHSLTLNYGTLLLGIIEQVVLPSIFGQNVNSLESAIDALLQAVVGGADGCGGLATFVTDSVGGGNTVNTIVENLCNQLITSAGDGVREFLGETLVVDSENAFIMQTTDGKPCRISEPQLYSGEWVGKPLPYVDTMGTAMMQCEWTVNIQAGNTTIETQAPFNGTRANF